jgi:hypothetical protein
LHVLTNSFAQFEVGEPGLPRIILLESEWVVDLDIDLDWSLAIAEPDTVRSLSFSLSSFSLTFAIFDPTSVWCPEILLPEIAVL